LGKASVDRRMAAMRTAPYNGSMRSVTALLLGLTLVIAACGSRLTPSTASTAASASPAPATTPSAPTTGTTAASAATLPLRFVLGFTHGGAGWTLLGPGGSNLKQLASLLAAATPLKPAPAGSPPLTCGPSGVMMLPAEHLTPHWTLGLVDGATIQVVANVAPCGATATSYARDEYASLNGRPVKAVGLVPRLLALSQALPMVKPLAVTPTAPTPGDTIQLTGDGWVGGDVVVAVFWCHQIGAADCTVKTLATLTPDAAGHIAGRAQMPADLPARGSGYDVSIEAKNSLLDFVVSDVIR
jgi:hypothetical protein